VLPSTIATTDYHTAGEPFRIVAQPPVPIPGRTVAERRALALDDSSVQALRAVLCSEPRGHADMYGGFVVPPDDDGADLGVLFWHKDGFSTACGHGTIALGVWAVETGRVTAPPAGSGSVDVVLDVPSGRVTARVHLEDARIVAVDFVNVPSWVVARDVPVTTSRGEVRVTVAYGGAIYATLPAADVGLAVAPEHLGELIALGRELRRLLDGTGHAAHPTDPRLNGIYGTIWFDDLGDAGGVAHQRNVTVFADGEVDRSPCGSGTCARLAILAADGRLPAGTVLRHDSIIGTTFTGTVLDTLAVDGRPAVLPQVTGTAYRTGTHLFTIDPHDPLTPGFTLR
jgi:proline racemase/trans-L-3-hydroxyproline dehydratase